MRLYRKSLLLAGFGAALLLACEAQAGDGSWRNAAGGSWPVTANWSGGSIGSGPGFIAKFSALDLTADATVTLDGDRQLGGMIFGDTTPSHSWTLNPGSSGTLTLQTATGTPQIVVNNQSATLAVVVAGSGGLGKSGAGLLTLNGTNTYTGTTTISAGTVVAGQLKAFGNSAVHIGAAATVVTGSALANTFTGAGVLTWNTAGATLAPGNASLLTGFAGTLNVNSTGSGKLALTTASQTLGSGSTVNIGSGGTLYLQSGATLGGVTFNLNGPGNSDGLGALRIEGATLGPGCTVRLLADSVLGGNGSSMTVAGPITGSGFGFAKGGSNTLILAAANTHTGGTQAGSGTLQLAHTLALQNSTVKLTQGGLLFSASVAAHAFIFGGLEGSGPITLQDNAVSPAPIALAVGNNHASTTYAGALSGAGSLEKLGNGALTLAGACTYTGATTVSAGTLRLARVSAPAFPSGLKIMPLGDSITFGYGGTTDGYRGPLYTLLSSVAPNLSYVGSSLWGYGTLPSGQQHNEGHSSYTIADISNNLDGLDSATFNMYGGTDRNPNGGHWLDGIADPGDPNSRPPVYPGIITLMVGTNDAYDENEPSVQPRVHTLLTKLTTLRPGAKLLVALITPSNRPHTPNVNNALRNEVAIFQAAGKPVRLVDMFTNFPADGLTVDLTHPNDLGYRYIADQWYAGIAALVAAPALPALSPLTIASGATFDLAGEAAAVSSLAGAGRVTLGPGGLLTAINAAASPTTFSGGISGAGSLAKDGSGTLNLAGANTYSGPTLIVGGVLRLSGSITNNSIVTVPGGSVLELAGGTLTAGTLHIEAGGMLRGAGTINATVVNDGSIFSSGGANLAFAGNVTNNGLIQLTAGSALVAAASVVNNGTIDLRTGSQALPAGLVNNGTILDAASVTGVSLSMAPGEVQIVLRSSVGFSYQLSHSATLPAASWSPVGSPQPGTGGVLVFTAAVEPADRQGFYRVEVTP